jgi:hypothetical protein
MRQAFAASSARFEVARHFVKELAPSESVTDRPNVLP